MEVDLRGETLVTLGPKVFFVPSYIVFVFPLSAAD
jgi:hypothetical protein